MLFCGSLLYSRGSGATRWDGGILLRISMKRGRLSMGSFGAARARWSRDEPGSRAEGEARSPGGARRALDAGGGEVGWADNGPGTAATLRSVVAFLPLGWGGSGCSQFSIACVGRIRSVGGSPRRRNSDEGRQAARSVAAPAGAKGWLVVSMCQMAFARRRAMSTRAIFLPRWRPRRRAVRWYRSA
jgi:hypothetical protein